MYRILVLANGALRKQGFANILKEKVFDMPVEVSLAKTRKEAERVLGKRNWHALIVDLDFDNTQNFDLIETTRKKQISLPILVFDLASPSDRIARALRSGATGIIGNVEQTEDIQQAVRTILTGRRYVHSDLSEALYDVVMNNDTPLHEDLSNRELETLSLLLSGKKRSQIAKIMSVSCKTVSVYRTRLMKKLCLTTTEGLIRYGLENKSLGSLLNLSAQCR
jgi:two-component system invasion response regulator UvrY